jgi:hypothetical protein
LTEEEIIYKEKGLYFNRIANQATEIPETMQVISYPKGNDIKYPRG